MNKFKKIISMTLVIILCLSVNVYAATESETNAANQLNAYGILKGRDNGDLALESTITRAEIATLVLRITGQECQCECDNCKLGRCDNCLDVDCKCEGCDCEPDEIERLKTVTQKDIIGHWAEYNIRKTIYLGYMKGYDSESYGPNDNITYQEVVTLMLRLVGEENNLTAPWPIGQIEKAKSINLVKGETVFPQERYAEKLTRGTVALILYNTMTLNTNIY